MSVVAKAAVFLDKDGTLIEDVPYNVRPDLLRLMPGVAQGLQALHRAGYSLMVISNQSGVAKGFFPETALQGVEARLRELLAGFDVPLSGFYYCPHFPTGPVDAYRRECDCRKPAPGLFYRAARDHGIDLPSSWFVGDILNDVEAGKRAGSRAILLDNGHETEWLPGPFRQPDYRAADLTEASRLILGAAARDRRVEEGYEPERIGSIG